MANCKNFKAATVTKGRMAKGNDNANLQCNVWLECAAECAIHAQPEVGGTH